MTEHKKQYWFKRRRYGYGWAPVAWQGWASVLILLAIVIVGAGLLFANPHSSTLLWAYLATVCMASVALVIIAAAKGPRPKWQWNKRANDEKDDL